MSGLPAPPPTEGGAGKPDYTIKIRHLPAGTSRRNTPDSVILDFYGVMNRQSAGGFVSPPNPGNLADDMVEEVESDSDEEDIDEDKKTSRVLSLSTPDEYVCV